MNIGNVIIIVFGILIAMGGANFYRMAKRAPKERWFFRMSAYAQVPIWLFMGAMFIVIGILY